MSNEQTFEQLIGYQPHGGNSPGAMGGSTTIIQSSAFNNRQGDNFAFATGIMPSEPGLREASNSYG